MTTDTTLVRRIAEGDAEAWGTLYREHRAHVYALCLGLTGSADVADDLTQEVFVRAARGAGGFRAAAAPGTWLYRIARNLCLDHHRRAVARRVPQVEQAVPTLHVGERADYDAMLDVGLRRLDVADREVIALAVYVGLGSAALGEVLDCSAGAARVRLHRALVRLRVICAALEERNGL